MAVGAVAKATFQRKKVVTEVIPEDVSRAKAGAWLTLISPITEWAGLKGDALRYRRQQLRIQQEETLVRLANEVHRKMADEQVARPVPPKILVPALEKASLESPADAFMIDRWANLLASAATKGTVEPRFVSILGELSGSQAFALERIAFNAYESKRYPARCFFDAPFDLGQEFWVSEEVDAFLKLRFRLFKDAERCGEILELFFERPGCLLSLIDIFVDSDRHYQWSGKGSGLDGRYVPGEEQDRSILESLGLIRRGFFHLEHRMQRSSKPISIRVVYHYLTELGVQFCAVCCRERVGDLNAIDDKSRASGVNALDEQGLGREWT